MNYLDSTKYFEIMKAYTQTSKAYVGCTQDANEIECESIERFASLEKAREALEQYECWYRRVGNVYGKPHYHVEEYYIEENEYDENDEWADCFGIWDFAKPLWTGEEEEEG